MATRQQLENRLAQIDAEIQALRNSLGGRSNAALDPATENRFLAERTLLRNQRSEIQSQLDRILVSDARSFYAQEDLGTGLVQIRTSDGLFAGRGSTLEEAKAAAIRNGANASALTNLVDPRAKAAATQGPGTVSTGDTTAAAAAARDNQASTQSPPVAAESASATGEIDTTAATTLPSNADPSQAIASPGIVAPDKLPDGQAGASGQTPAAVGSQGTVAAQQIGGVNLDTPDENTNQVSYIYRAYQVTSNFRQGRFTQELQGAQIFFPIPQQQQRQQNTDTARSAPSQAAAATARQARQAGAVPQGTVGASAGTPGVTVTGELGAFVGAGETNQEINTQATGLAQILDQRAGIAQAPLATDSLAAEGFLDPTADQVPVVAALTAAPPTSGSSNSAVAPVALNTTAKITQGAAVETALQDQLKLARRNKSQVEKALAEVEARIARGEGNPLVNRDMRSLYASNLALENRIIADLEQKLAQPARPGASNTNTAPQTGAKEY